jgi:hypothetical protein
MPDLKPEWLAALRAVDDKADLRFNTAVNRWEFILTGADMQPRSQFWCDFDGDRDPVTGMKPYRELNDAQMRIALENLQRTFVGNPYDGEGTVQRDVGRRYFFNKYLQEQRWQQRGAEYADYIWDHRRQIRDAGAGPLITVATELR